MTAELSAVMDISRLVSRIGTGPLTGIDRVEAAWLDHLSNRQHLLLCRVWRGQALLPPEAGRTVLRWCAGDLSDFSGRSGWRENLVRHRGLPARARAKLRKMALHVAPASGRGLMNQITRHLPAAETYLNIGHSNLSPDLLRNLNGLHRVVMIHDTIPLDHPEFTRSGQSDRFRSRFMAAVTSADSVIAISNATAAHIDLWRRRLGVTRSPNIITAPIGTTLTPPDSGAIPANLDLSRPFFVTLGTIEPRKNHALLLDVWDRLAQDLSAADMPQLLIIGRRGWENHEVFARLDRLAPKGDIFELSGLSDGAVAALLLKSRALLMPSRAEGFGLPLTEAAGRAVPVLCSDLPVARELLGNYAHYLSPDSINDWTKAVSQLIGESTGVKRAIEIPSWKRHFTIVEGALTTKQD